MGSVLEPDAEHLLARHPAVYVHHAEPVREHVGCEVGVPRADDEQVEAVVPKESAREKRPARRAGLGQGRGRGLAPSHGKAHRKEGLRGESAG